MAAINKVKKTTRADDEAHLNWMGGKSWDIKDPVFRLEIAAASCLFGEPMYYHDERDEKSKAKRSAATGRDYITPMDLDQLRKDLNALDPKEWRGMTPAQLMTKAIDEALDVDPERTLQVASKLRNEHNIRTTPQVIMVRAANHRSVRGTGLIRKYAPDILKRLDECAVQLAYQLEAFGKDKPIPNSLKKAWRYQLEHAREYHLAKYRMESRSVKLVDVVNLVHPKGDAINKLVRGELKLENDTWEDIISKKGSNKASWTEAVPVMGHMALLRNLRNFGEHKVEQKVYLPKLVETAAEGKQLPFRYVSAYEAVKGQGKGPVMDAIEKCLMESLGNLPYFPGRTMSLCDNSGSALSAATSSMGTMHVNTIANLTGILTGMRTDEGYVGVFGDRLTIIPVRKSSSVFDQLEKAERAGMGVGGGTENGIWLFWDNAIKKKEHWDQVFVYSDMQAGHGGLYGVDPSKYSDYQWRGSRNIDVGKLINKYRATVNPKVNVFLVQVAGYQDTIVPEYYDRVYMLGGWSDAILKFAASMIDLNSNKQ